MKVASLFTGIGGFDLGFEAAGFEVVLQAENDKWCKALLALKWPHVRRYEDVRFIGSIDADIICGGDPCQARSRAKGTRKARHPDLSGYFLALVGRSSPRWVVRENVPAPDVGDFAAGLGLLGYDVVIVELDARDFTGQSRRRQFIVGSSRGHGARFSAEVSNRCSGIRDGKASDGEGEAYANCITTHAYRISESDTLFYEPDGGKLRFLDGAEAEALQGFPRGWTAGFSRYRRFKLLGNAVPPPMIEWIARAIAAADPDHPGHPVNRHSFSAPSAVKNLSSTTHVTHGTTLEDHEE